MSFKDTPREKFLSTCKTNDTRELEYVLCLKRLRDGHYGGTRSFIRCPNCKRFEPFLACNLCMDDLKKTFVCAFCDYKGTDVVPNATRDELPDTRTSEVSGGNVRPSYAPCVTSRKGKGKGDLDTHGQKSRPQESLVQVVEQKVEVFPKRKEFLEKYKGYGGTLCGKDPCFHTEGKSTIECPQCGEKDEYKVCNESVGGVKASFVCGKCRFNNDSDLRNVSTVFIPCVIGSLCFLFFCFLALWISYEVRILKLEIAVAHTNKSVVDTLPIIPDGKLNLVAPNVWIKDLGISSKFILSMDKIQCAEIIGRVKSHTFGGDVEECTFFADNHNIEDVLEIIKKKGRVAKMYDRNFVNYRMSNVMSEAKIHEISEIVERQTKSRLLDRAYCTRSSGCVKYHRIDRIHEAFVDELLKSEFIVDEVTH